ncbi:hypothetical protein ID866_4762 [Astraeus odoratus]|nr:hypothetical protein ID866_4762 [Astraeus odoratus]
MAAPHTRVYRFAALLHMLQIASKTGATLSELGNSESATSVLICAAQYEEALRNQDDPDRTHEIAKARVTTLYFSSRMEAAWRDKNEGLAAFMADKIIGNDRQLSLLSTRDRELLATKLLDIGKSILRTCHQSGKLIAEGSRAPDTLRWMQKAFQIIEPLACATSPELAELKRSILRSLARGYFLASSQDPENLTRAEVALEEVISTIDPAVDHTSSEYQQLRWMKLAVVKRRKAGNTELLQALVSIIDNMTFSENDLSDILQELRTLPQQYDVVATAIKHCIRKALDNTANIPSIERLLVTLLFHCSKGDSHTKAMKDLEESLQGKFSYLLRKESTKAILVCHSEILKSDIELSKIATSACVTLIWQYGDRHYHASRWTEAADWFICGTHAVFSSLGPSSSSKCFRKAALCYLQQKEYAKAAFAVKRSPKNDTLNFRQNVENLTEAMTLIRCIVRLAIKLLGQPGINVLPLIHTLLNYFKSAKTLVENVANENDALVLRDLSWLWRTAYNCAVEGCSNWDNHPEEVSNAFDIARQLLELYISKTLTDVEPSTYLCVANASFAATSGRVILTRERLSGAEGVEETLRSVSAEIKSCKARISGLLEKVLPDDRSHVISFLHLLRVFYVEAASALGEWSSVLEMIEEAARADDRSLNTFEAFGDILAILHACLTHSQLSLDKFSRWLRSICSILLSKGTAPDRSKAIQYFDQANAVLEEYGDLVEDGRPLYPVDERLWLLSTAYNTGIECLQSVNHVSPFDSAATFVCVTSASVVDEAKRWFECATVVCRFVPDAKARAEKISETYTELLARYTSD